MAHRWSQYRPSELSNAELFMQEPYRRCENCGVVQQLHKDYSWGKVISRKWLPLVGRCKGEFKNGA